MTEQNSTKTWQKISVAGICLAVFLLPLFFLPFTANFLDFNKQTLLIALVLVSLFAWLLKSLIEEKISLDLNWANLSPLVFILVVGGATLFSAYRYASFWGWPLAVPASFITSLALVLFYFLLVHLFRKSEEVFGLVLALVASSLLAALLAVPQILGKFVLPFDFSKSVSFNTIGSLNALALFLAAVLPIAVSLLFVARSKLIKLITWLFMITALFLLLAISFQTAWLVLLISSSIILVFGIARREFFSLSRMSLPMFLLAIALFALAIKTPLIPTLNLPAEVSPSFGASLQIAFDAIKNFKPPISWLFGSGPGTFVYDYSHYRPVEINQTAFWGTRFVSSSSEITDRLATTGLLGLISFLALIVIGLIRGLIALVSREFPKTTIDWTLLVGVLASFAGVSLTLFLYPGNLSLMFLFWLLLALVFNLAGGRLKNFDLHANIETVEAKKAKTARPIAIVIVSFVFIIALISSMGIFFVQGQRYIAEVNYATAVKDVQKNDNVAAAKHLGNAIRLTGSFQDNYWRDLTQVYLFRINDELNNANTSQQEKSQRVNNLLQSLVAAAKSSSDVAPDNVANWAIRGYVYSNIMGLISGADQWAINAYNQAIKFEPSNPFLYTALGQVYASQADNLTQDKDKAAEMQKALDNARTSFAKAQELKSDYAPARFQLAMIDVRENKVKDAITKLEETKQYAPSDTGLAFQLGLIYQADKQDDRAQAEFERAVVLDPNYSNARYFLGLIYDKKGEKQKAIEQFEKIVALNPDNQLVKQVLDGLKAGKSAADIIAKLQEPQPPIQEQPAEQLQPGASPSPTKK
jgi:tetratricopeptide (TPR) repeat protein